MMENYNLNMDIKEYLHKVKDICQITLTSEESEYMYQQLKSINDLLPSLNIFNERIRNVAPFSKFWQVTKLRPDIEEKVDLPALLQNSKSNMQNGYFVVNGVLYETK